MRTSRHIDNRWSGIVERRIEDRQSRIGWAGPAELGQVRRIRVSASRPI